MCVFLYVTDLSQCNASCAVAFVTDTHTLTHKHTHTRIWQSERTVGQTERQTDICAHLSFIFIQFIVVVVAAVVVVVAVVVICSCCWRAAIVVARSHRFQLLLLLRLRLRLRLLLM